MESKRISIVLALLLAIDTVVTVYAVFKAPYPAFVTLGSPAAYLNIYIHVPVAIASYILYTAAFISAIVFLAQRKPFTDRLAYSAIIVGSLYSAYTLVSGSLWAAESWGSPWNWDPRETGVLLLFLTYLAYFALRASISDPDRKPVVASTYAVAAYAMVPVSYLAPRLAASSLHPTMALLQSFMRQPAVMAFFYMKLLLVTSIGLVAAIAAAKLLKPNRLFTYIAAVSIIALLASSLYLALQYSGGIVARVYMVFRDEGGYKLLIDYDNKFTNITVAEDLARYEVNGRIALIGHIVKLVGFNGTAAKNITILIPSCVIINVALYALLLSGIAYMASRLPNRLGSWVAE